MDDDSIMRGFLRLRPDDQPVEEAQANPLHIGEWEMDAPPAGELPAAAISRMRSDAFTKSGNPLEAIEAFVLAIEAGVYPSTAVLCWLAKRFGLWHAEQGKISLDNSFGLQTRGNKPSVFKAALLEQRNEMLLLDVDRLMHLGASREEAATAVAARLEQSDWNKTGWDLPDIGAGWLIQLHKNKGCAPPLSMAHVLEDPEWVKSWLEKFPPLYLPNCVKSRR